MIVILEKPNSVLFLTYQRIPGGGKEHNTVSWEIASVGEMLQFLEVVSKGGVRG